MKCLECGRVDDFVMSWKEADIKPGLFVVDGRCEHCGATYAVIMQIFDKSKLKKNARVNEFIEVITSCDRCSMCIEIENRAGKHHYCDDTGKRVKDVSKISSQCKLKKLC